jgi:hypothetical protein
MSTAAVSATAIAAMSSTVKTAAVMVPMTVRVRVRISKPPSTCVS